MDKRQFIKRTIGLFSVLFSPNILANNSRVFFLKKKFSKLSWEDIRNDYSLHEDFINLESGYYNIVPKPTLDSFYSHVNNLNIEGSYFMRNKMKDRSKIINKKLSKFLGCPEDELVVTRNTTESLDLIISGYPWKKNDHVIFAHQDYGSMKDMFYQVSKRYGINYDIVSIPNDPKDDQEIINILEKINDDQSRIIANAERKILKILEGDCDTAVGVYAKIDKDLVNIKAELFSVDGKQRFFVEESENKKMVKDLSIKIGEKLKSESKGSYKR